MRHFHKDQAGGVAAAVGIALAVMIGFGAAATEISTWLLTRRAMQGAADAAAVSALNATAHGGPDITTQARGVAAQNGWSHGTNGITVSVNQPPTAGNFTGNAQAVEVIIAQPQPLFFSGILPGVAAPTIRAHGVAAPSPTTGNGCMLALGTGNSISIQGNGALTLSGCDLDGNGNIQFSGINSRASAHSINIKGTVSAPSQLALTNGPGTQNAATTLQDPYAGQRSFNKPTGACQNYTGGTPTPNTVAYCSMNITSSVSLPTGVYFIEGGCFCISGNSSVNVTSQAPGVTIVLTGTAAAPTVAGTVSITGQANVSLTALPPGPGVTTAGLIFFQDPIAAPGQTETIAGNGNVRLEGAVYFPNETINLGGNGNLSTPGCLQIIGLNIVDTGNATLGSNCVGTGTNGIGPGAGATRLVE